MAQKQALLPHLRDHALRIANHEMGHYVIARSLGFKTGDVKLKIIGHQAHNASATIFLTRPVTSTDDMKDYLERRILVLYAGAMAETLPPHHSPQKSVDNDKAVKIIETTGLGAEQDHAKAREFVQLLRNIQHPQTDPLLSEQILVELNAINDELWGRARDMVNELAETITGLGGALVGMLTEVGCEATFEAGVLEGLSGVRAIPKLNP